MARVTWNDNELANSDEVVEIEGSLYFPGAAVRMDLLRATGTRTSCPWRGQATYYSIVESEKFLENAAWSYENPRSRARRVKDCVAFWKQVSISKYGARSAEIFARTSESEEIYDYEKRQESVAC